MTSSRPYLIRAMYEWIADNNMTPHVVVNALVSGVVLPDKFIVDNKMVLNISADATRKLLINNQAVEFDARFSGVIWHIYAPIESVVAIYALENGRGMIFEEDEDTAQVGGGEEESPMAAGNKAAQSKKPGRPNLKIVK